MDKKGGEFDDHGVIREGFGDYFLHLTETEARSLVVRRPGRGGSRSFTLNFEFTNAWIVTSVACVHVVLNHSY
jgi:hypothetical protein